MQARTAVEDQTKLVIFYFSFRDTQKQQYRNLLLSLVTQLSAGQRVHPDLEQAYTARTDPSDGLLEQLIVNLVEQTKCTRLVLDALDESPSSLSCRQDVMDGIGRMVTKVRNLSILAFSRPSDDIEAFMQSVSAESLAIEEKSVNADISLHVEGQLRDDPRFKGITPATGSDILAAFDAKAGGM